MEEYVRTHVTEVAVFSYALHIVFEYLRVESIADDLSVGSLKFKLILKVFSDSFKVFRRKQFARSAGNRLLILEHQFLKLFRESAVRLTHHAFKVRYYGIREIYSFSFFIDIFRSQAILYHKYSHVADSF